jgi:hypothetical protein
LLETVNRTGGVLQRKRNGRQPDMAFHFALICPKGIPLPQWGRGKGEGARPVTSLYDALASAAAAADHALPPAPQAHQPSRENRSRTEIGGQPDGVELTQDCILSCTYDHERGQRF